MEAWDGVSGYEIVEYLVGLNPFTFSERKFYTSFDGQVGFVSEEDDGGFRMILSNGEEYDFQKLLGNSYKYSTNEEKLRWKLHASYNVAMVNAGERIIKQISS